MGLLGQTKEVIKGYTPNVVKSLGSTALILSGEIKGFAKNLIIDITDGYLKYEGYGRVRRDTDLDDENE